MNFSEFGLSPEIMEGIDAMGYEQATPVQQQVLPLVLNGHDVLASAQTGTGKTAAFVLPIIHRLLTEPHDNNSVNAMVIVPTRELAIQIAQNIEGMSYFTNVSAIAVYGGGDGDLFTIEKKALSKGVDIAICTPGRLIAHLNMGYVKLNGLKYFVLDEADRMLDMGFLGDILKIMSYLPKERQNLLFSATMPPKIKELANKLLSNPQTVNIAISKPAEKIVQKAFVCYEEQKPAIIKWLLESHQYRLSIVFCSNKESVKNLTHLLKKSGLNAKEIHSNLEQLEREKVLLDYKNMKFNILVATDILSRGVDIDIIDLVINYDVPNDGEDYVHRIGRTARAEADGTAYTLVSPKDQRKLASIEELIEREIPKAAFPEAFGEAPEYTPFKKPDRKKQFGNRPKGPGQHHQKQNNNKHHKQGDSAAPKKHYKPKRPNNAPPNTPKPQ